MKEEQPERGFCKSKTHLLRETSIAPLLVIFLCAIPHLGLSIIPQAAVTSFVSLGSFGLFAAAASGRVDLSEFLFVLIVFFLLLPTTVAVCRAQIDRGVRKVKAKAHARRIRKSTHTNRGTRSIPFTARRHNKLAKQEGTRKVTRRNSVIHRMKKLLKCKGQDDAIDIFNHFQREDPRYAALVPWAVNLECIERMDKPVRSLVSYHALFSANAHLSPTQNYLAACQGRERGRLPWISIRALGRVQSPYQH